MSARKPGNGILFVAILVLADAASPAWVVCPTRCVESVLVEAEPAGNIAGAGHEGFAAATLTHLLYLSAHGVSVSHADAKSRVGVAGKGGFRHTERMRT